MRGRGDNYFLGVQFELPRPWYPALSIRMLNGSILFQSLTFHSRGHSCPTFINTANLLFPFSITHLLRARVVRIGAAIFQAVNNVKTLPKALRTQGLTALTSNFGLVGFVQHAW